MPAKATTRLLPLAAAVIALLLVAAPAPAGLSVRISSGSRVSRTAVRRRAPIRRAVRRAVLRRYARRIARYRALRRRVCRAPAVRYVSGGRYPSYSRNRHSPVVYSTHSSYSTESYPTHRYTTTYSSYGSGGTYGRVGTSRIHINVSIPID